MMLRDVLERYPMPTKEQRRRQIEARPAPVVMHPRDDGPDIRRLLCALRWEETEDACSTCASTCLETGVFCERCGHTGKEPLVGDRLRERVAILLGVDRASIEHAERRLLGRDGWHFVQLPDTANDGRPVSPRDRLTFNLQCPDVTALPRAPERKRRQKREHIKACVRRALTGGPLSFLALVDATKAQGQEDNRHLLGSEIVRTIQGMRDAEELACTLRGLALPEGNQT